MSQVLFVERSVVQVGGVDLDDLILSVSEKSSKALKEVNTMNKGDVVKGFKKGNSKYMLDIDAERIVDDRVPDWHAMMQAGTVFKVQIRYNVGKPVTYGDCMVESVSDATSEGDSSRKIAIRARTRKEG
jgi:hypothetical protein